MSKQTINIGTQNNDGTGDSIRDAFDKSNQNFSELYSVAGLTTGLKFTKLIDAPSSLIPNSLLISDTIGSTLTQKTLISGSGISIVSTATGITITNSTSTLASDPAPTLSSDLRGGPIGAPFRAIQFADPADPSDLSTKNYVDTLNASTIVYVNTSTVASAGDSMTGPLLLSADTAYTDPALQAVTKRSLDKYRQLSAMSDVTITSVADTDLLMFGNVLTVNTLTNTPIWTPGREVINVANAVNSDISITRTSNSVNLAIKPLVIVNGDINAAAGISQSKLSLVAASTVSTSTGITQANLGVVALDSALFTTTAGWATLTSGGNLKKLQTSAAGVITWTDITSLTAGSYLTGLSFNGTTATTWAVDATVANTPSKLVARDSFGDIFVNNVNAVGSVIASYADLAEMYLPDTTYKPGTVLVFGGINEVTVSTTESDCRIAGVVSTNPAYLMNSSLVSGLPIALSGRVPCQVVGKIKKGDMLVSSAIPGVATSTLEPKLGSIIGKSLSDYDSEHVGIIEVVVGRM